MRSKERGNTESMDLMPNDLGEAGWKKNGQNSFLKEEKWDNIAK